MRKVVTRIVGELVVRVDVGNELAGVEETRETKVDGKGTIEAERMKRDR